MSHHLAKWIRVDEPKKKGWNIQGEVMNFSVSLVDPSLGAEGKAWCSVTKNKELRWRESIVACKGTRLMVVRTIASQLAFTGAWIDHLVRSQDRSKVKSVGQFLKNDPVPVEMGNC